MNLAYVVDGRMPTEKANGYQSAQMCQAFIEAGCGLDLLVADRRRDLGNDQSAGSSVSAYYNLRVNLETQPLKCLDLVYHLEHRFGVSERSRISHFACVLRSWTTAFSVARKVRSRNYDCIYIRNAHLMMGLAPLLSVDNLRKVVFELHTLPVKRSAMVRQVNSLKKIGGVVVVTSHLKDALVREGVPTEKICVEHDCVDLPTFELPCSQAEARDRLGLPMDAQIASYVGKFHTMGNEKGIPEILRCAKVLLERFPRLYFYFVGGPMDRHPHYLDIIKSEGLTTDRFVFMEKRPVEEVPYYLKASDLLLMPFPWTEHYAYYMSPLKLFEYMSSRRPMVATRLPSVMEILRHDENALLAEPGDPVSLAASIGKLLTSPERGQRLAENAYSGVRHHTWNRRAERILDFVLRVKGLDALKPISDQPGPVHPEIRPPGGNTSHLEFGSAGSR